MVVACPPPAFAWHGSSSCWLGLCLPHASALPPFHPQCSEGGDTALHAEHPLPWDLVPSVTLMSPCPCLWMYVYVYVYRQRYWNCILGTPGHIGAPAQEEDVRNAIFCSVAEESPIKVSFGLWCFWHACLCSHAPPSHTTCSTGCQRHWLSPGGWLCALP